MKSRCTANVVLDFFTQLITVFKGFWPITIWFLTQLVITQRKAVMPKYVEPWRETVLNFYTDKTKTYVYSTTPGVLRYLLQSVSLNCCCVPQATFFHSESWHLLMRHTISFSAVWAVEALLLDWTSQASFLPPASVRPWSLQFLFL